jgi:hypothetical protein
MRNYYIVNTPPPADIDKENAHIVDDEQLDQELDDAIQASFDEIDQDIESDKKT